MAKRPAETSSGLSNPPTGGHKDPFCEPGAPKNQVEANPPCRFGDAPARTGAMLPQGIVQILSHSPSPLYFLRPESTNIDFDRTSQMVSI